jgi:hypothetical protein
MVTQSGKSEVSAKGDAADQSGVDMKVRRGGEGGLNMDEVTVRHVRNSSIRMTTRLVKCE